MFTFEDLTLIDSKQMQTVLKDVVKPIWRWLKTASDAVKEDPELNVHQGS